MRSSMKVTAGSLLAAAALGAAALIGCSSKDETKKKGNGLPDDAVILNPSQPGPGSGSQEPPSDGAQCDSNQDADFISPKCQSCLAGNCCEELQGCFDLPTGEGGGSADCNDYATCIDDCATKSVKADRDACYGECDTKAADGVASAYSKIEDCAVANCKSACAASE